MTPQATVAVAVALAGCVFDLHTRRIPNALTLGAAFVALATAALTGGFSGVASSAAGWAVAAALWLPLYALGGMGAGDVKLMAAIGAWLGPADVLYAALYAAIAGAIIAIAIAVVRGCVRQTCTNVQLLLLHWRVAGLAPHPQLNLGTATSPRLAYAVPILAGTMVALWLR
ncbi:MAG TPA: prepilin peptidase [Vicinamibacterales bacterium]